MRSILAIVPLSVHGALALDPFPVPKSTVTQVLKSALQTLCIQNVPRSWFCNLQILYFSFAFGCGYGTYSYGGSTTFFFLNQCII